MPFDVPREHAHLKLRRWLGFFSLSLLLSVVSMPSLAAAQVSVIVEGARIHAEAQGADLREVLKVLADKAGLRIVWDGSPSGTVALRWSGISVEDAVRDLLRNKDHL